MDDDSVGLTADFIYDGSTGFNFKVDKNVTSLKFAFEIDGKRSPGRIEVGKSNSKPEGDPFVVSLK